MAVYAVGDVQGCFATLQALLSHLRFNPSQDRLWFLGDLVNRGPSSLEVLRWAAAHDGPVQAVLGNHDLHLLRRYWGINQRRKRDTLDAVLAAPDCHRLMDWLCRRPLVACESNSVLVHAGFLPQWSLEEAMGFARQIESILQGGVSDAVRGVLLAAKPEGTGFEHPDERALTTQRLSLVLRTLTNIRVCDREGRVDFSFNAGPDAAPSGYRPWYEWPHRRTRQVPVVFGHWSALGFFQGENVMALDTGAVWGQSLTAVDLATGEAYHQASVEDSVSEPDDKGLA